MYTLGSLQFCQLDLNKVEKKKKRKWIFLWPLGLVVMLAIGPSLEFQEFFCAKEGSEWKLGIIVFVLL